MSNKDKAGVGYWDQATTNLNPKPVFSDIPGLRGKARREWITLFDEYFEPLKGDGRKLIELGCGGSAYLPFFAKRYGFEVHGIDYSEHGCKLAQEICQSEGVDAKIHCVDFFNPPDELIGAFDVVVSFGLIEHFTDTDETVLALKRYLKPGGVLLTVIPNMGGMAGILTRFFAKKIYDIHKVISPEELGVACMNAGLAVKRSGYFMFSNFGVLNFGRDCGGLAKLTLAIMKATTLVFWILEEKFGPFPPGPLGAPYVICVAKNG